MREEELRDNIAEWLKYGWNPFPVICFLDEKGDRKKKPPFPWKDFETRQPTQAEIDGWFRSPLSAFYGLGVALSGAVVLDFDQKDGKVNFAPFLDHVDIEHPMWTRTASGGVHFFYRGSGYRNAVNIFDGDKGRGDTLVDIRADGGMVVVGKSELWDKDPFDERNRERAVVVARYETQGMDFVSNLPIFPESIRNRTKPAYKYQDLEKGPVLEGNRFELARSLSMKLLNQVIDPRSLKIARESYVLHIQSSFVGIGQGEWEEYHRLWNDGIEKKRKEMGASWPNLTTNIIKDTYREALRNVSYEEDMAEWQMNLKQAVKIGTLLRFELGDGMKVEIDSDDLFSQAKFRTAFFNGTKKVLPKISPASYERMLRELEVVDVVETGASLQSIIKEVLDAQFDRVSEAASEKEAIDYVRVSSWAKYGRKLYFQLSSLTSAHAWLAKSSSPSKTISAFRDIGIRQETDGMFKYWVYERDE